MALQRLAGPRNALWMSSTSTSTSDARNHTCIVCAVRRETWVECPRELKVFEPGEACIQRSNGNGAEDCSVKGDQLWQGDGNHNHDPVRKRHPCRLLYTSSRQCSGRASCCCLLLLLNCSAAALRLLQTDQTLDSPLPLTRSLSRLSDSTGWNVSGAQQSCRDTTAAASTHFASDPSICHFPSLDLSLTALVLLYSLLPSFLLSLSLCSSALTSMTIVASECSWFLDC